MQRIDPAKVRAMLERIASGQPTTSEDESTAQALLLEIIQEERRTILPAER